MAIESSSNSYSYQLGGTLDLDAPSYVHRQADEDFYQGLKAGEFCYVLNARQMGKSSLQTRTRQRLESDGIRCAMIDITAIGTTESTAAEWYAGMIDSLVNSFGLYDQFDLDEWWAGLPLLSPVQRFSKFLELVLLRRVSNPIVIFIDEIDSVRSLPFDADDFFAVIRSLYNLRSTEPMYKRLTFALIGAATPVDLIRDMGRTPFNVGRAIELAGFRLDEAEPLRMGLGEAEGAIAEILEWTGGQPFLTQKLCALVRNAGGLQSTGTADRIAEIVQSQIIDNWEGKDDPVHLRTIRDRVLEVGSAQAGRLLGLYRQVLEQPEGLAGDDSTEEMQLRLSGLVMKQHGKLRIFNRIYREVFDRAWVDGELGKLRPAFYGVAIAAWLVSGSQDESRLLRGQALQDARIWAEGKSLGDDDRRFLDASQELDKRDIQRKFDIEAEEKLILANANRKANQQLQIGLVALSLMVMGAIASGFVAKQKIGDAEQAEKKAKQYQAKADEAEQKRGDADQQRKEAEKQRERSENQAKQADQNSKVAVQREAVAAQQYRRAKAQADQAKQETVYAQIAALQAQKEQQQIEIARERAVMEAKAAENQRQIAQQATDLEKRGTALLRLPPDEFKRINSLISAMELGQDLRRMLKGSFAQSNILSLDNYPATSPVLALRIAINNVLERNVVQGEYLIGFSSDGQYIRTGYKETPRQIGFSDQKQYTRLGISLPLSSLPDDQFKSENIRCENQATESPKSSFNSFYEGSTVCSSDRQYKATSSIEESFSANPIRIYDQSNNLLVKLEGLGTDFSKDGKLLVVGNRNKTQSLYDLSNIQLQNFQGYYATFSPDGKLLVTFYSPLKQWIAGADDVGGDGPLLYDDFGRLINKLQGSYPRFSPNGEYLTTHYFSEGGGTFLYDRSGTLKRELRGTTSSFSPDGRYIVTSGRRVATTSGFSPDGRYIAFTGNEYPQVYDTLNEKLIVNFEEIIFSKNEKFTFLYDFSSKEIKRFPGVFPRFSPKSRFLIINSPIENSHESSINIYDLRLSGNPLLPMKGNAYRAVFSSDEQRLLIFSKDGIFMYDVFDGKLISKFEGNKAEFSPDGNYLAVFSKTTTSTSNDEYDIHLYDRLGNLSARLHGFNAFFSPNAKWLVLSLNDSSRIYDMSGRLLAEFPGTNPALTSDERYLMTFSGDRKGSLWLVGIDNSLDTLLGKGCSWLQPYLVTNPEIAKRLEFCQVQAK